MYCDWEARNGQQFTCKRCGTRRRQKVKRRCRTDIEQQPGFKPERTNNEVLVIITTFCTSCPAWNPAAEKKKCKYCGCGSSDTVENLHKRRIRNCPKGHWTEASLQRYLHPNNTSSTGFEKSP